MSFYVCVNLAIRHNTTVTTLSDLLAYFTTDPCVAAFGTTGLYRFLKVKEPLSQQPMKYPLQRHNKEMLTNTVLPILYQLL